MPVRREVTAAALCALALVTSACVSERGWGPLAVVENGFGPDALAEGTLRVDPECVNLERGDRHWLLVWPSDRTTWNEPDNSIEFRRRDSSVVTVRDGQYISVGGGEGPVGLPWLASPRPGCAGIQWFVSDVVPGEPS